VPTFRADVREISPYTPGRSIESIAAEHGLDPADIIKLASNEHPVPPLEAVQARMREVVAGVYRYPDNDVVELRRALGDSLDVPPDSVWVGGGSSELLRVVALAVGGPGTSAVYPWPSFVIYRLASVLAMSERVEVPLERHRNDLDAMRRAIREDTTVVYVCNPNNPTGTIVGDKELADFVESVPERTLVVIDEAYHEYVTSSDHTSAVPMAVERPNVVVCRTFSKVHGLAALRVGYAVARPETVVELRKAQAPFTVSSMGQEAALESLRHSDAIRERVVQNARMRTEMQEALIGLELETADSQANFVAFDGSPAGDPAAAYLRHGIIVRVFGGWVRATVGTPDENRRFVEASAAIYGG